MGATPPRLAIAVSGTRPVSYTHLAYSIKHVTDFRYEPEARESLMEVRMQPRSDARQRCLTFSLDVSPQADIMSYQDFLGNTVHHLSLIHI